MIARELDTTYAQMTLLTGARGARPAHVAVPIYAEPAHDPVHCEFFGGFASTVGVVLMENLLGEGVDS